MNGSRRDRTSGTAGAIVALVAFAASVAAVAEVHPCQATFRETQTARPENETIKAVAAAVFAAARELSGADRILPVACEPLNISASLAIIDYPVNSVGSDVSQIDRPNCVELNERLLDMPPPVC